MEFFLKFLLLGFGLIGLVLIAVPSYSVFKRKPAPVARARQSNDFSKPLMVLEDDKSSQKEKAKAFIALMVSGYVLIHLMLNQGKNYNDKKQIKRFRKYWSNQQLKKLNALDGDSREY